MLDDKKGRSAFASDTLSFFFFLFRALRAGDIAGLAGEAARSAPCHVLRGYYGGTTGVLSTYDQAFAVI